jgi:dCTP deaminase
MAVLARQAILDEIKKGNIKITPFNRKQVGPGSVDLHLDNEFRVFKRVHRVVHVHDNINPNNYTEVVKVKDYLLLMPGESVLGITKEKISLSPNICGRIEGRSRFARIGLLVHLSASFIHPGADNRTVLEINNLSHMPLAIYPGTKLCQFIFERTEGSAKYKGKYARQNKV